MILTAINDFKTLCCLCVVSGSVEVEGSNIVECKKEKI
jgi:hypothetical protein